MTRTEASKIISLAYSELYNTNDMNLYNRPSSIFHFTSVFIDGTNINFDIDYIDNDYITVRKNTWGQDEEGLPTIVDYEERGIFL